MSKISNNICLLAKHDDIVWYVYNCSCGCGEQVFIEVSSPKDFDMVTMEFWVTTATMRQGPYKGFILDFFAELWWRIKNATTLLLTGNMKLQTGVIIDSKEGVQSFIDALQEALDHLEGLECQKK